MIAAQHTNGLRVARTAEFVYATVALVLGLSLPWPPSDAMVGTWLHWMATGMLAAAIALRMGRPNRAVWYVAALLSGYVLVNALVALSRVGGATSSGGTIQVRAAIAFASIIWITQLIVAVCLYATRRETGMPRRQ